MKAELVEAQKTAITIRQETEDLIRASLAPKHVNLNLTYILGNDSSKVSCGQEKHISISKKPLPKILDTVRVMQYNKPK